MACGKSLVADGKLERNIGRLPVAGLRLGVGDREDCERTEY
jgi:hypothetical protein